MGIEGNYHQMENINEKEISDKNIWIIDSGYTQHMTNNFACLYDVLTWKHTSQWGITH